MAYEKTCTICGAEYKYCPYCEQFKTEPKWKIMFCSEPCRETYMAINRQYYGHISASEALNEIKKHNVKIANKAIARQIKDISKAAKNEKIAEAVTAETVTAEEVNVTENCEVN